MIDCDAELKDLMSNIYSVFPFLLEAICVLDIHKRKARTVERTRKKNEIVNVVHLDE